MVGGLRGWQRMHLVLELLHRLEWPKVSWVRLCGICPGLSGRAVVQLGGELASPLTGHHKVAKTPRPLPPSPKADLLQDHYEYTDGQRRRAGPRREVEATPQA